MWMPSRGRGVLRLRPRDQRIHPAFKWGGLFVLAMQPLRLIVGGTGPWLAFAQWLTR